MDTNLASTPTGQKFHIRTLQDIFNLPTADMMSRCLRELGEMMVSTRAYSELLGDVARDLAAKDGKTLHKGCAFKWPEVTEWNDDGSCVGTEITFVAEEGGQVLSRMVYTKDETAKEPSKAQGSQDVRTSLPASDSQHSRGGDK